MRVLDLFSGIGGFSLGLERAGMQTVGFCEIDPWCRRVLRKHWPGLPIYRDIKHVTARTIRGLGAIDVVCGGFPCQDISAAGRQAGIDGERSGLWGELARVLGEVRPRFAIVENVPMLLAGDRGRWFQRVLGDLAALGLDAQWHCIPASAVGAPHRRDRVWIVAYPNSNRELFEIKRRDVEGLRAIRQWHQAQHGFKSVFTALQPARFGDFSNVPRVAHGVPRRVDRIRGLGNAVVPQVVELVGRAVMRAAT